MNDDAGAAGSDAAVAPGVDASRPVRPDASTLDASGTPDAPYVPPVDCAGGTELIYLLTTNKELYSFDPTHPTLTKIGTLDCNAGTASPYSMAVDRAGIAWVLYDDGTLYRASIKNASCVSTTYVPNQLSFKTFGMGFVSNGATPPTEALYACALEGQGKLDTGTLTMSQLSVRPLGTILGCEYTGTGDGRLFEFDDHGPFVASGLQQVDTINGAETALATLTGIKQGNDFAFSFWGGYFYFYTNANGNSTITQFDPNAQTYTVVVPDAGIVIDGAGVSTCAPYRR